MPSASNPPRSSWFSLFVKCHLFLSLLLLHIVLYPDYLTWVPLPVLLWRMDGGRRGKKWRPFDLLRMSDDPNAILVYPTSPRRCVWYVLKNGTATFWHFLGVMFAGSPKACFNGLLWFSHFQVTRKIEINLRTHTLESLDRLCRYSWHCLCSKTMWLSLSPTCF